MDPRSSLRAVDASGDSLEMLEHDGMCWRETGKRLLPPGRCEEQVR